MKEKDPLEENEEKSLNLTTYKPEEEIFQRLHLCEYLRELSEIVEGENKHCQECSSEDAYAPPGRPFRGLRNKMTIKFMAPRMAQRNKARR